ncbi:carbamoyltransferase family protein [Sphingomonas alpina]|uniref:Carbamoyltransferase n=1 Tax=Sphingomonas alpina TaxID=653931 RepID=A0A7H0LF30_9SPHN|nr:carbamoyltransferase C-terminal domain-containing protein [Sphingomonas alpina]QNQ08283.1 carbamoyltransferase [Sphingomonas alpina]
MIVLGINHSAYHDSSAAIVRDGIPLFAIAEERLSKVKHDAAFPTLAIKACLDHVGITITEIDQIVLGWQPYGQIIKRTVSNVLSRKEPMPLKSLPGYVARNTLADYQRSSERMMRRHFGGKFVAPRRIDHHYAHALSAYVPSGMEEATVVVIDGRGAWEASSIWHGKGNRLDHVETVKWPNSLGLFYATFTGFLGFEKYADEWKVMGLAPYGTPGAVDLSPFVSYANGQYQVRSDLLMLHEGGREYAGVERFLGPARNPDAELTQADRDLAWAVQDMCERVECDFITKAIERTGCRNLCIAGGVGLNSKANGLFLQKRLCDEIFVQPAAGDDGVALGAALAPSFEGGVREMKQMSAYLGPSFTPDQVRAELIKFKLPFREVESPAKAAAELLAKGALVGWFQGREEFGPRALGHRSIIADPKPIENRDRVNNAVKFREEWRPFAPSVLEAHCDGLFESYQDSPFMILTFPAKPLALEKLAAAIHVDGSARVQTVREGRNDVYFDMITEFYALTGTPGVMNTSFNLKGEVIVNTPFDAVRTFYTSGLDALVIENFVVEKGV